MAVAVKLGGQGICALPGLIVRDEQPDFVLGQAFLLLLHFADINFAVPIGFTFGGRYNIGGSSGLCIGCKRFLEPDDGVEVV
ncbi:MAG: hypothetical protein LBK23_00360 [Oscillospiraceae bacterium]|nr:hypothetical protein [Oscillospiraceae bacterium]